MIRFEEMTYTAPSHPGRMGERWQANAARSHVPAPDTAAHMLRSAWCAPSRCGGWPGTRRTPSGDA